MAAAGAPAVQWEHLTDVERTCLGVAYARWHASAQGSLPCTWPDGQVWYQDPIGAVFVEGIPPAKQRELEEVRLKGESWLRFFCAVRTAEIDHQIQCALIACPRIKQMVLLGAGMDTRAWRLLWPPGFSVCEVDSQQVLDFKQRMLSSSRSSGGGTGSGSNGSGSSGGTTSKPREQLPPLSCERRTTVVADASQAEELWSKLLAAGLSADTPTVWVLEGFIGYLELQAGNALLRLLATNSAPGSRIIMTAPPTPDAQRDSRGGRDGDDNADDSADPPPAAPPAAAAGEGGGGSGDSMPAASEAALGGSGVDGVAVQPYRPKLHHTTFEEPTETLARLSAAGWRDGVLLTQDELSAKYGVPRTQPILLGHV